MIVAFIGKVLTVKIESENFDESLAVRQNSSEFSTVKVLHYTVYVLILCYIVQSIIWLGYETTSNCLAYTSYLLALHPDKQDTLYQEIEKFYQENPVSKSYGGFRPC